MNAVFQSRYFALIAVSLSSLLVVGATVGGCSSSSSNPQPIKYNVGSDAGDTGKDAKANADASSDANSSPPRDANSKDDGRSDAGSDATATDASFDAATCATDAGCWACAPSTTAEFLNQCTASHCSPFKNAQRLPDYDGGLPPL